MTDDNRVATLEEVVEAMLVVADSNCMSDDEEIPVWPNDVSDHFPGLTVGALRDFQVVRNVSTGVVSSARQWVKKTDDKPGKVIVEALIDQLAATRSERDTWKGWYKDRDNEIARLESALRSLLQEPAASLFLSGEIEESEILPAQKTWTPCNDRLPTELSGPYVWVWDRETEKATVQRVSYCRFLATRKERRFTHWKPTGLQRPEPPEVE